MGSTGETSVKLILFSGKKGEWEDWYFGFEARAVLYRYDGILSGVDTAPTVAEYKTILPDTTDEGEKEKLRLYHANSMAFSHLVTSLDVTKDATKVALSLLRACETDEYPHGDAHSAVVALNGYYNVKSVANAQLLLNKFHAMELKTNQDPAVFVANM
jgi:hypothetical protein